MKDYEIAYSRFLADITQNIAQFITYAYANNMTQDNSIEEPIVDNNVYDNVDNSKVELIDYSQLQQPTNTKTILLIVGAIILLNLIRGK